MITVSIRDNNRSRAACEKDYGYIKRISEAAGDYKYSYGECIEDSVPE